MQISRNNKRLIVQISVIIAIPLILLAFTFLMSVGIHRDQAAWFYSIGDLAGAMYFRERADEFFLLTIAFGGSAIVLLAIAYFVRREY